VREALQKKHGSSQLNEIQHLWAWDIKGKKDKNENIKKDTLNSQCGKEQKGARPRPKESPLNS